MSGETKENKESQNLQVIETYSIKLEEVTADAYRISSGEPGWIICNSSGKQTLHPNRDLAIDGSIYRLSIPPKKARRLTLADGLGKAHSPEDLFNEAHSLLTEVLKTQFPSQMDYLAAQVLMSYHYDEYQVIIYTGIEGPPGTGKTQAMKALSELCFNSLKLPGNISEAALFREMNQVKGTMIFDEVQRDNFGPETDRHKIFVEGNQSHGVVVRCCQVSVGKAVRHITEEHDVFTPKILIGRSLPRDEAVSSRMVKLSMRMYDDPAEQQELLLMEEKLLDPIWKKRAQQFRNNCLYNRQLRKLGLLQAPGKSLKYFLNQPGWSPRDRQVYNSILCECPTEEIAGRVIEGLKNHKNSIREVRAEELDAQVIYATRSLRLNQNRNQSENIYAKEVIEWILQQGQGKYHSKAITRIWRDHGLETFTSNQGVCVKATLGQLNEILKRLDLPVPSDTLPLSCNRYIPQNPGYDMRPAESPSKNKVGEEQ